MYAFLERKNDIEVQVNINEVIRNDYFFTNYDIEISSTKLDNATYCFMRVGDPILAPGSTSKRHKRTIKARVFLDKKAYVTKYSGSSNVD